MDRSLIAVSAWPAHQMGWHRLRAYARGVWASVQTGALHRRLCYSRRAHHLYKLSSVCVPWSVDCGLSELSRAGYLLNTAVRPGCALAIVTTDLPLPATDPPSASAPSRCCNRCKICAEEWSLRAIPLATRSCPTGSGSGKLTRECYLYWQGYGTDCWVCMAPCSVDTGAAVCFMADAEAAARKGSHQSVMTGRTTTSMASTGRRPLPPYLS